MISNHIHLSETGRELSHQTEFPGMPGILAIQVFIALGIPRIPIPGAYDVASFCPWVKASAGNHWLLNSVKVLGSSVSLFLGFDWGRDGGWGGRRVPGEVAGRAQYVGTKRTTANFWRARQASRTVAIREGVSCCSFQRWSTRAVKVVH